jgi:hypothetical protein
VVRAGEEAKPNSRPVSAPKIPVTQPGRTGQKKRRQPNRKGKAGAHNSSHQSNHGIRQLEARMERMEGGLESIQRSLARLELGWSTAGPAKPPPSPLASTGPTELDSSVLPPSPRYPGLRRRVHTGEDGCERYTGPTALPSLILDVKEFIPEPLGEGDGSGTQQAANSARESLGVLFDAGTNYEPLGDDLPPEMPPVAIVEAMIEPYFEFINPRMPIWTRKSFRALMEACEGSGGSRTRRAAMVCANNMVLLTLTAKFLRATSKRRAQAPPSGSTDKQRLSSMELSLFKTFLVNAKRALTSIEQLLSPSLISIQAFLSLVSLCPPTGGPRPTCKLFWLV